MKQIKLQTVKGHGNIDFVRTDDHEIFDVTQHTRHIDHSIPVSICLGYSPRNIKTLFLHMTLMYLNRVSVNKHYAYAVDFIAKLWAILKHMTRSMMKKNNNTPTKQPQICVRVTSHFHLEISVHVYFLSLQKPNVHIHFKNRNDQFTMIKKQTTKLICIGLI